MSNTETEELVLQYMRLVVRQNDGILNALEVMQRQNDNLSTIMSEELRVRRHSIINPIIRNRDIPSTPMRISTANRSNIARRSRGSSSFFPHRVLPHIRTNIRAPPIVTHYANGNTTVDLPGYISESTNTVDEETLNATMNDSPIRVRPSFIQINRATISIPFRDISHNNTETICPIDRELLHDRDRVLQIIECGHYFRESNLRRHFRNNTRCPLCRYDIRDYIPDIETTYEFPIRRIPPPPPSFPPPPPLSSPPPRPSRPPSFDIENPFETRPSTNINPSLNTTDEIRSLLNEAVTDAINSTDASGNIIEIQYSVSVGSINEST